MLQDVSISVQFIWCKVVFSVIKDLTDKIKADQNPMPSVRWYREIVY